MPENNKTYFQSILIKSIYVFFRSEDYSEDEGYTVITEKSTISALMDESGVAERWHQEPKKQLVMVCRLDCDKGYSAAGRKMFKYHICPKNAFPAAYSMWHMVLSI